MVDAGRRHAFNNYPSLPAPSIRHYLHRPLTTSIDHQHQSPEQDEQDEQDVQDVRCSKDLFGVGLSPPQSSDQCSRAAKQTGITRVERKGFADMTCGTRNYRSYMSQSPVKLTQTSRPSPGSFTFALLHADTRYGVQMYQPLLIITCKLRPR